MKSSLKFCFCGALIFLLATHRSSGQSVASEVEQLINAPVYRHSQWGIAVADAGSGERLFALNSDKLMRPASVTKLFSVAAALEVLGKDYRFKTPVVRSGEITSGGTLQGNLILVASGDPTLGGRTDRNGKIAFRNVDHIYAGFTEGADVTDTDQLAGLKALAEQVVSSGIKRISGDVLVDDRMFAPASGTGSGPAKLTPIVVNDNMIDVVVRPGEVGKKATVRWVPDSPCIKVDADVATVSAGSPSFVNIDSSPGRLRVRGQIAANRPHILRFVEVEGPADFARSLFIDVLRKQGIEVPNGNARNDASRLPSVEHVARLPKVAEFVSPPFSEAAKLILKVSHNLHSGLLPLLIAAREGRRSLDEGLRAMGIAISRMGLSTEGISFGSAAGGSQSDFVTPTAVVDLLRKVANRPDAMTFLDALPVLGVDGTLWDVVSNGSPAKGKAKAKTGTYVVVDPFNGKLLLTSKALAGYLEAKSGRKLVFAAFVNNVPQSPDDGMPLATRHGRTLGKLCEILYEHL